MWITLLLAKNVIVFFVVSICFHCCFESELCGLAVHNLWMTSKTRFNDGIKKSYAQVIHVYPHVVHA